MIKLAYLAPRITRAILDGTQPASLGRSEEARYSYRLDRPASRFQLPLADLSHSWHLAVHQETGSPIAAEALRRIGELYALEEKIRGRSAELRRTVRHELAKPVVDALKPWLKAELHRVPPRSGLADAIRYALVRWDALCRFLEDGRVELDTNTVERAVRPIALGRKNHMFAWETRTGARTFELTGVDKFEPFGAAPIKGARIPFLMAGGGATVLDTVGGRIVWQLPQGLKIVGLQLGPDDNSIVVRESAQISLFAFDPLEKIDSLPILAREVPVFAYNDAGDRVVLFVRGSGGTGSARLLDVPQRKEIGRFDAVAMTDIATENSRLALATQKKLSIQNGRTGALEREVDFENPILQVNFDHSGRALVVVTNDQKIWVLDAAEGGLGLLPPCGKSRRGCVLPPIRPSWCCMKPAARRL